jgi:hypothetical protein
LRSIAVFAEVQAGLTVGLITPDNICKVIDAMGTDPLTKGVDRFNKAKRGNAIPAPLYLSGGIKL